MSSLSLKRTSAPAVEPVSVAEARAHLRVDSTAEDALIAGLISAAREWVEQSTRRSLITQTWRLRLEELDDDECIELPRPPLQSVSSFVYVDSAGNSQTWASSNYLVSTDCEPGELSVVFGEVWPPIREQEDAVTITYVAGYGATGASVPAPLKTAILLLVGHWYANRETVNIGNIMSVLPFTVESLISPYRVHYF